jgi:hypothetical protein
MTPRSGEFTPVPDDIDLDLEASNRVLDKCREEDEQENVKRKSAGLPPRAWPAPIPSAGLRRVNMTVFINVLDDEIEIRHRAEGVGDYEGVIGDCCTVVRPGQKAFGRSYRYWKQLGKDRREIRDDRAERDHA